ncbi:hypothetical protein N7492_002767 [Penicillium capsulatum]|uniref:DUF7703 domain-containing protein n=1 Tax=Penicillium capsulatum TaxID=69766 RepID=A0A9W9LWR8_9EURO|nr:hypothetical protein N7492_002767 [Penicillium capsulatum]KAJ6122635.1 hypothetical protein N7512_005100 [Penicillium capsulatum]
MYELAPASIFGSGEGNEALGIALIVFMSISLFNAIELAILIPLSFRRYRSLYFWALLTSTVLGVIPATLGPAFQFFNITPLWLSLALSNIGFIMMVPNQSVVLYSRLHLVSQNAFWLRAVRWMIIIGVIFVIVPTVLLNFGSSYIVKSQGWMHGFEVVERIQLTWFSVQESFISFIYICDTIRMIKLSPGEDKKRHKILYELVAVNILAIAMDISLMVLEFLGFYFTQVIFKATVYSIKLKLEFAVLGMLVSIVHSRGSEQPMWQAERTTSSFS